LGEVKRGQDGFNPESGCQSNEEYFYVLVPSFSHTRVPNLMCILLAEESTKSWLTVDLIYACGVVLKYVCVDGTTGNA
jgi:hypothetical protein